MSLLNKSLSDLTRDVKYRVRRFTRPDVVEIGPIKVSPKSELMNAKIQRLLYRGNYEHPEIKLVSRHLTKQDRVLEIGAGLGVIGALCAKIAGSDNVVSVEANPQLRPLILETHRLNSVAPTLQVAMVGSTDGTGVLFVEENFHSSSGVRRSDRAKPLEVPAISLRTLLKEHKPTFLIVDVEGYEKELFNDVELTGVTKVCVELHPHIIGDAACMTVLQALASQGFMLSFDEIDERTYFFRRLA